MTRNRHFTEMRTDALRDWCSTVTVPNISRDTFTGIFTYLLSTQHRSGGWVGDDNQWTIVMTAIVLKALGAMKFRRGDRWDFEYLGQRVSGSVASALSYIADELRNRSTEKLGEDIWDACQALLAVAAFGDRETGAEHVQKIADDWKALYQTACESDVRWCGPAYLAAMVDVLVAYRASPEDDAKLEDIVVALAKEEATSDGQPSGCFPSINKDVNINRWTTSLVLRTLCGTPGADAALIERSVAWLLGQLQQRKWESDRHEAPMFVARCLDALCRARHVVTGETRVRVDREVARWNSRLASFWNEDPERRCGSLKSYVAVSEYLAALTVPAPVGLMIDQPAAVVATPGRPSPPNDHGKIFVVHGRDMGTVRELQNYIQNVLQLGNPIILRDQPSGGDTIIAKFEREAARAGLVFVLITPDDVGGLAEAVDAAARRARQNVIFEMGYFIGKLGRTSGRLVLLKKGAVELPSDIGGVIQIDISSGVEAAGEEIRREIGPILDELRSA